NDLHRTALQNRLVNLCFQGQAVVGSRVKRSKERSSTRQIALCLCNGCLEPERIHVVWSNIENLIKLLQGFGETTKGRIETRVFAEQGNIARVEPLGFVEVGFASLPLASPPRYIS